MVFGITKTNAGFILIYNENLIRNFVNPCLPVGAIRNCKTHFNLRYYLTRILQRGFFFSYDLNR